MKNNNHISDILVNDKTIDNYAIRYYLWCKEGSVKKMIEDAIDTKINYLGTITTSNGMLKVYQAKTKGGKIFLEKLINGDILYQEKNKMLEIEIASWDLVECLSGDKQGVEQDINRILRLCYNVDVELDSIDQLNPDLPIVSALFTIK